MKEFRAARVVRMVNADAPRWLSTAAQHAELLPHTTLEASARQTYEAVASAVAPWSQWIEQQDLAFESRVSSKIRGSETVVAAHAAIVLKFIVRGPRSRIPLTWHSSVPESGTVRIEAQLCAALQDDTLTNEIRAAIFGQPLAHPLQCPVVFDPWTASTLIHECIGHSSETDNYRRHFEPTGQRLGLRWTHLPLCVVDDPTRSGHVGAYEIDDEGHPANPTTLVDGGIWSGLLHNEETASAFGDVHSCNGRRVPHATSAIPRMSVTFVRPGESSPHELISSIGDGIYCVGMIGGGSVGRDFILRPAYGLRIKAGRVTEEFVRRFDVVGDKLEIMSSLMGIGNDLRFFDSAFGCDKEDQNDLPVTQGSPHLAFAGATLRPVSTI